MNTLAEEIKTEETDGYKLAISFKPFIDPKCTEHMEIVKDMAKSINRVIINNKRITTKIEIGKPADKTMEAAIASRELEGVKSESNGGFVTFTFENVSGLQMFKLGQSYSYLANL